MLSNAEKIKSKTDWLHGKNVVRSAEIASSVEVIEETKDEKMSKILNLIVRGPEIAGVKDHKQFSYIGGRIYDDDVKKLTELFDRRPDWSISDRIRFLFLWVFSEEHDYEKGQLIYDLAIFAAQSIDINTGKTKVSEEYNSEKIRLTDEMKAHPEIEEVLSVDEATSLMGWAPT